MMISKQRLYRWGLILFSLLNSFPLLLLVVWSFAGSWLWPQLWPEFSIQAWSYLTQPHSTTWSAVIVSLQIAILATWLNFSLALPAAYALARFSFRGKRFVEALLFAPLVIPPFIAVMGMYTTLIRWGLTDTLAGIILVHMIPTLPYVLRPLIVSFRTFGTDQEDQAKMLGATFWQRFRYVLFPHLIPAMITGASLSILVSLSQYLITLLVGGGLIQTLPILMFPYINGKDPALGASYAVIFIFVSIIALFIVERLLNRYYGRQMTIHF